MAMTFRNLKDHVLAYTGLDAEADDRILGQIINSAARDVEYAHTWAHRQKEAYLVTVTPYSTGTIAVSNLGTAVTGTGTTFPSFNVGDRKFALSYDAPWYWATRGGATSLTLSRAYQGSAETAATYVIYADTYDLEEDVQALDDTSFRLHDTPPNGILSLEPASRLDEEEYIHGVTGHPEVWSPVPDYTEGIRRIRLWPIPDAVYVVLYRYWRTYAEMEHDGDLCDVPESRRDLVVWKALEGAAPLAGRDSLGVWAAAQYERGLATAKANEKDIRPAAAPWRAFDRARRHGGIWMSS